MTKTMTMAMTTPNRARPAAGARSWPWPWRDRAGRLSALKLAVLLAAIGPACWIVLQGLFADLGPRPVNELIHQTGSWAVRFLVLSLAVTPLRRLANWSRLIIVRRMLGVTAMAYAVMHLTLYVGDQKFDLWKVGTEIVLRFYLTIGFVALTGLIVLGMTSTDDMIKRLGAKRWQRLHRCVYGIAGLALIHFFLQSKLDVSEATLVTGVTVLLLGHRLMLKLGLGKTPLSVPALAVLSGAATVLIEAGWYYGKSGVPVGRVLAANLNLAMAVRPAWWVLAIGLGLAALSAARTKVQERQAAPVRA